MKKSAPHKEVPSAAAKKESPPASPAEKAAPGVRVLKVATCPSLSGRSTLTYQIGVGAESEFRFRLEANSGNGQFNRDWVSLASIRKLLDAHPEGKPMTSVVLHPLFRRRSLNSPAFLLAALKAEGLVLAAGGRARSYLRGEDAALLAEMTRLTASGGDPAVAPQGKPAPARRKAAAKAGPGAA